jgi:hypothetical protein
MVLDPEGHLWYFGYCRPGEYWGSLGMSPIVSEGGCLCGAVRYRITGAPRSSSICFCRSGRLACGAPAVTWFVVAVNQYVLLGGQLVAFRSSPEVVRSSCARCGTPVAYQHVDDSDSIDSPLRRR